MSEITKPRVLLIDDEEMLLGAYRRMMRRSYDVETAVGGARALELLSADSAFAVVICDLLMPGMTGIQVFEKIEQLYPRLASRFIFLSGGAYTPEVRAWLERTGNGCLEKPVDLEALLRAIAAKIAG